MKVPIKNSFIRECSNNDNVHEEIHLRLLFVLPIWFLECYSWLTIQSNSLCFFYMFCTLFLFYSNGLTFQNNNPLFHEYINHTPKDYQAWSGKKRLVSMLKNLPFWWNPFLFSFLCCLCAKEQKLNTKHPHQAFVILVFNHPKELNTLKGNNEQADFFQQTTFPPLSGVFVFSGIKT